MRRLTLLVAAATARPDKNGRTAEAVGAVAWRVAVPALPERVAPQQRSSDRLL